MRQVPILMYHWFRESGTVSESRSPQLEIEPARFEEQMEELAKRGYRTLSLADAFGGARPAPRRSVVLTFDDGTADFWQFARPVLRKHSFGATLFVVSHRVGETSDWDASLGEPARPLMNWEQLRTLKAEGFEIGSHTARHRPLTEISVDDARRELAESRERLAAELGQAPAYFAYPRGFYRDEHKQLVREAGYAGACAVILGWSDLFLSDRFALKRMTIKGTESMSRFRLRLALGRLTRFSAER